MRGMACPFSGRERSAALLACPLAGFSLALLLLSLAHGPVALPERGQPRARVLRGRLDAAHLAEHPGVAHPDRGRVGRFLGRPQLGAGALRVPLQVRARLLDHLALGPVLPLGQGAGIRRGPLRRRGELLTRALGGEGRAGLREPLAHRALRRVPLGVRPREGRTAHRQQAHRQGQHDHRDHAPRTAHLMLVIRFWIPSSREASSLSWAARWSESWRMLSAILAELAADSWLAAAAFFSTLAFSAFISWFR